MTYYQRHRRQCIENTLRWQRLNPKRKRALDLASYYRRRERVLARQRQYAQSPRARRAALGQAEKQRAKFPGKYAARRAMYNAVRRGALVRRPCRVCGNPRSEGHHPDYAKPLEVDWLCRTHHAIEDATLRRRAEGRAC